MNKQKLAVIILILLGIGFLVSMFIISKTLFYVFIGCCALFCILYWCINALYDF